MHQLPKDRAGLIALFERHKQKKQDQLQHEEEVKWLAEQKWLADRAAESARIQKNIERQAKDDSMKAKHAALMQSMFSMPMKCQCTVTPPPGSVKTRLITRNTPIKC